MLLTALILAGILLIVPEGIEIFWRSLLELLEALLIVPEGIEI